MTGGASFSATKTRPTQPEVQPSMTRTEYSRLGRAAILCLSILALGTGLSAQVTPDQAAEMILNSARKAYNEKAYPVAVARFREFLAKFAGHKDAPQARYGLALALVDGP